MNRTEQPSNAHFTSSVCRRSRDAMARALLHHMGMTRFGHYDLGRAIACGKRACRVAASERLSNANYRIASIKLLVPPFAQNGFWARRFRDEAVQLARLVHPSTESVLEWGSIAGIPYTTFEHVTGRSLREIDAAIVKERWSVAVLAELGYEIACALAEAHTFGLIHGGVSLDSLVLTPAGRIKLSGFGFDELRSEISPRDLSSSRREPHDDVRALAQVLCQLAYGCAGCTVVPAPFAALIDTFMHRPSARLPSAIVLAQELAHLRRIVGYKQTLRAYAERFVGLRALRESGRTEAISIQTARLSASDLPTTKISRVPT